MKQLSACLILFSAILLTGCATTFSSQINTVNQLPEVLNNKTYTLQEHTEQAKEPEYLHATEDVKARLKELGFQEAESSQAALRVSLQLVATPGNAHIRAPFGTISYLVTPSGMVIPIGGLGYSRFYPPFMSSAYRFSSRSRFPSRFYSPFYSPFAFGNQFHPFYAADLDVRQYIDYGVEIVISDTSSGKVLYSVVAKTTQSDTEIGPYITLLVESALREFPKKSGESQVEIQLEK